MKFLSTFKITKGFDSWLKMYKEIEPDKSVELNSQLKSAQAKFFQAKKEEEEAKAKQDKGPFGNLFAVFGPHVAVLSEHAFEVVNQRHIVPIGINDPFYLAYPYRCFRLESTQLARDL